MATSRNFFIAFVLAAILSAPAAAGARPLTLILDWFPNIDHLPIYAALEQGFFAEEGLDIKIISPSDASDGIKLAASGNADIAVSYEPQTIIAVARGFDVVVFGRLIAHPLTTLLFLKSSGVRTPEDLTGKKIGYTVPGLMDALLAAFARINGVEDYEAVNVGFSIVQSLTAGRVDAVMGPFKTYETVSMAQRGYAADYFELEKYGIPDYDELVFIAGRKNMEKQADRMAAFIRVIDRAVAYMRKDPEAALQDYFRQLPEADRRTETEAFRLTLPYYASSQALSVERWRRFADFALQHGLIDKKVDAQTVLWRGKTKFR